MANLNRQWRVKVYLLGGDGDWNDNGTGFLEIDMQKVSVYNEDDPEVKILNYKIKEEDYRKQGETILTWMDQDGSTFALSFQDKQMAQEALEEICKIQSKNPSEITYDYECYSSNELAVPTTANLSEVLLELLHGNKEKNAGKVIRSQFLPGLFTVSDEISEEKPQKELVFQIFKQLCKIYLVHLCSHEVISLLLDDPSWDKVLKGLSNDPIVSFDLEKSYIASKFNNVLAINDENFLKKVTKAHRLQFIRDTALVRTLEDSASMFLYEIQLNLWKEIVGLYINSSSIRQNLCEKLENSAPFALDFLMELCNIVKINSPQIRHDLYEALHSDGIVAILDSLSRGSGKAKVLEFLGEIYTNMLEVAPFLLKSLLFSPACELGNVVMRHIAESIIGADDLGTVQELGKLIKSLLEPDESMYFQRILEIFYKELSDKLIEHIDPSHNTESVIEILKIFTMCVEKHGERAKLMVCMSQLLPNASKVLKNNKHIAVYSFKLLKAVVMKNDTSVNNYLIRMNLFEIVIEIFTENSEKQGLIFSCILNLFEQIKKSSLPILQHFVKKFVPLLKQKNLEKYLNTIVEVYNKQKSIEES